MTLNLTRATDAAPYAVPLHHGVCTMRLQGHEAGFTERFWVGVSLYRPGGEADKAAVREETIYVVLDGELIIDADGTETALRRLDSARLARGEVRSIRNLSGREALLLVAVAHPEELAS